MTTAWFITTYTSDVTAKPTPRRWCSMDSFTSQIVADGGSWEEIEVGANFAIVKVKAAPATLTTIAATFTRLPGLLLTDSLSSLTTAQKNTIQTQLTNMGYTSAEIQAALGNNIGTKTLGDLLKFAATRRIPPRFNTATQTIVFDSAAVACSNSLTQLDGRIQ